MFECQKAWVLSCLYQREYHAGAEVERPWPANFKSRFDLKRKSHHLHLLSDHRSSPLGALFNGAFVSSSSYASAIKQTSVREGRCDGHTSRDEPSGSYDSKERHATLANQGASSVNDRVSSWLLESVAF